MAELMLASFTAPLDIGCDPMSVVWMFPLLAGIAAVYKATKMRVLFVGSFLWQTLTLFATLSGFMILAMVVLNLIQWLATS